MTPHIRPIIGLEEVTPEMFGAIGDGITDDTDALKKMLHCIDTFQITGTSPTIKIRINGLYKVSGLAIAESQKNLNFEGRGKQFDPNVGFKGKSNETVIFTVSDTEYDIQSLTFSNLAFRDAATAVKLSPDALVGKLHFEGVTFNTMEKAIHLTATGKFKGLVMGSCHRCLFYNTKYGFYSEHGGLVNNFHFDKTSWEHPIGGGYQVYIGGIDGDLSDTIITIKNCVFNAREDATSIPIYIKGRAGNVVLDSVHFADYGYTETELITLDGEDLIMPDGTKKEGAGAGVDLLSISNSFIGNRGSLINNVAGGGVGIIALNMNYLATGREGAQVLTNARKVSRIISTGNLYAAAARMDDSPYFFSMGDRYFDIAPSLPLSTRLVGIRSSLPIPVCWSDTEDIKPYEMQAYEYGSAFLVTTGDKDRTFTLVAAKSVPKGASVIIKKQDRGSGTVIINRYASDTIDEDTSYILTSPGSFVELVSDGGTHWYSINHN
jgi:hypothetical protein